MTMTAIVVLTCFIVLGLYDAIIVFRTGIGCSVSRFLQRIGFKSPLFVFMFGLIMGHLFFAMAPECDCPAKITKSIEDG